MQKDGQCSPEATQTKSCAISSCLFSKPSFLFFLVPFLLTNLVYQAGGSTCNGSAISQLLPGALAGLFGIGLYSVIKFARRGLKHTSPHRQMPIQSDYMRRTNLTISELDLDENSA